MEDKQMCKCPTCGGSGEVPYIQKKMPSDTNKPLAKKLRKKGYTIRQIAEMLGYKHPGSISNLLK